MTLCHEEQKHFHSQVKYRFRVLSVRYLPRDGDMHRHLWKSAQQHGYEWLKEPDSCTVVVAAFEEEGTEVGPQLMQK